MKIEKLLAVLENQKKDLQSLLEAIRKKQEALVSRNTTALEDIIKQEEKLLLKIQNNEEKRLDSIIEIYKNLNISNDNFKLSKLISVLEGKTDEKQLKTLRGLNHTIKGYISEIMKLNRQNMFLIQHTRQFVSETISAILNTTTKSLIDKKG